MALNSNIRKVSLQGSCDLTNFKTDIHDYEGFEQDNSFFLNKRKVNWWKRNTGEGEIGGGLRGDVNGAYFDVYKDDAFIGKISREYYKLEPVSSDAWRSETLQSVVNPFPASDNKGVFLKGKYLGKCTNVTVQKCGDYYFVGDASAHMVYVYDSSMNLYDSFSFVFMYDGAAPDYISFFYRAEGYSFSYQYSHEEKPTITINIPAGYVYVYYQKGTTKAALIYNISTKARYFNTSSQYKFLSVIDGFKEFNEDVFIDNSGAVGYRKKSIDYGEQYLCYQVVVVNNNLYLSVYNWLSGYSYNELKLFYNGSSVYSSEPGRNKDIMLRLRIRYEDNPERCRRTLELLNRTDEATLYTQEWYTPEEEYAVTVKNYSKKYGPWAVNYISNYANNIAHNYKKLFQLEGNESGGTVTDIDGYNDTYIYFHYGSDYYRISIATADNFADVVQSLNSVYFIFNTTSYLNAYYNNGNDWFCSCDDWNDRVLWSSLKDEVKDVQNTSRLGNNWQTLTDMTSVSEMIEPKFSKIAVTPDTSTLTAYESGTTWDGSDNVYTSTGALVDTSTWTVGHSLTGYYFAQLYNTQASYMSPYYIDSNYTCPEYLDENLVSQKQAYTVYWPEQSPHTTADVSLVKQGSVSVDGFSVSLDTGDVYSVPTTSQGFQRTTALLDTQYLCYTGSIIILNKEGSYLGINSATLGIWTLVFLNQTEVDPLKVGDSVFVINGVEYTYKAESNRILDFNGSVCCTTNLMKYIGFSTRYAYFYSTFDKAVYIFEGDNALKKYVPLERYSPAYTVYEDVGKIDTLNISSLDIVLVNLDTAVLILFDSQFIVLETGKINAWSIDETHGTFIINGIMYSLIKSALSFGNYEENEIVHIPIEIETQFYGDPDNETNNINDCVYLTIDNLQNLTSGEVTLHAESLCNGAIVKSDEKTMKLKQDDFNELSQLLIKYQPKLQECKGLKLFIKSDFEIAELKIGTSVGAMNQTTKKI